MPTITFKNRHKTVEAPKGTSILEAALGENISIYHTCGGNASCSTCRVLIHSGAENLSSIDSAERQILDSFDLKPPHRLACQAMVMRGDVELEIPDRSKEPRPNKTPKIDDTPRGTY